MKLRKTHLLNVVVLLVAQVSFAGTSFERAISEIQILSDRVRINIGVTYGTCGVAEGWWGWSISDPRHKDWLSMALSAQAQGRKITVFDDNGACAGPGSDTIGLEGMSIK